LTVQIQRSLTRRIVAVVLAAMATAAVVIGPATVAHAAPGPADDRLGDQPTASWTYYGVSTDYLSSRLSENHARLTDLRVDSASPFTVTATMVSASGPYGTGYWWYFGQSRSQVDSLLVTNHARPVSLQRYWSGSTWLYAVVMVPNSGADYKQWTIAEGSATDIANALSANPSMRIAGLSTRVGGSSPGLLAILVDNNLGYAWYWYLSQSAAQIGSLLSTTGGRLIDLDPNPDGTFNVVLYAMPGQFWWFPDLTGNYALTLAGQHGARIVDLTRNPATGRYAVLMVNNITGLSATLRDRYEAEKLGAASYGFRLKKFGGPVLASLQDNVQFEPASALKVLYHLHVLRKHQAGLSDNTPVGYHFKDTPSYPSYEEAGICPDLYDGLDPNGQPSATEATNFTTTIMKDADEQMMWMSDNRMTRAITDRFGSSTIVDENRVLVGLAKTVVNHNIGCGQPPNLTTLQDLAHVYEAGYLRTDPAVLDEDHRKLFHDRAINEDAPYDLPGYSQVVLDARDEATKLGKDSTEFEQNIIMIGKSGHYVGATDWGAYGAVIGLPVRTSSGIGHVYYTWGDFINDAKYSSSADIGRLSDFRISVLRQAMIPEIHQAIVNW
jgi:hypothetical protein